MHKFNDARDWFFEKRFGMFIHWGLYAIHGLHEQEQRRYAVPADEYVRLKEAFHPADFHPESWLDLAENAGMDYMVFTAKHHDGFCLWNTKLTDFNVAGTPFGRDVVGELAAACRKRNFPLEMYYSVVDWHHPTYPNQGRHHEIVTAPAQHDLNAYMEFLKGQIRELCTNYGPVYGIWWDMNVPQHRDPSVHSMIRSLQPAAIINNRGFDDGDYSTPERDFDPESANPDNRAFKRPTEACQSVGVNSWGYRREEDYFSVLYFCRSIARTLAMGGNYLLNVGPDENGVIPPQSTNILKGIGKWFRPVREALTATPAPGTVKDSKILVTKRENAIYVICPDGLESSTLSLRPLDRMPGRAILLNTGEAVECTLDLIVYERTLPPALRLRNLPVNDLNGTVPVFKLVFPENI